MKPQAFPLSRRSPTRHRPHGALVAVGSLALALALAACSKQEDNKTAGQQLDSAIAKTGQAAAEARAKAEQSAAEAKAKTESAMASAGTALKDAIKNAESSAKQTATKAEEKLDDVFITTSVSSAIGKESDLSVLKINVDTKNGAVTLNGSAPIEAAREKAGRIAKAVKGVNSVDNKLVVKAS